MIYNINNGGSTGNMIIRVTVQANKVGKTITCTLGSTVLTDIVPDDLVVEFRVKDFGDWVISCDGESKTVNTYYYGLYLVNLEREIVALVPIMTSNTTPYGTAFASSILTTGYEAYRAFDGDPTTTWESSNVNAPVQLGYTFVNPVKVKKVRLTNFYTLIDGYRYWVIKNFIIQGSNDNFVNDVHDVTETLTLPEDDDEHDFECTSNEFYLSYRINILNTYSTVTGKQYKSINSLQFYGYEE